MAMISSQPWQFIIGLSLGALLIGGISSIQILEKSIKDDKTKQTNYNYRSPVRSSASNLFNYTTAARPNQYGQTRSFSNMFSSRPVTRSRSIFNSSSIRQPTRNLDYNYRGTRSANRGLGVTYNM